MKNVHQERMHVDERGENNRANVRPEYQAMKEKKVQEYIEYYEKTEKKLQEYAEKHKLKRVAGQKVKDAYNFIRADKADRIIRDV